MTRCKNDRGIAESVNQRSLIDRSALCRLRRARVQSRVRDKRMGHAIGGEFGGPIRRYSSKSGHTLLTMFVAVLAGAGVEPFAVASGEV